MTVNQKKRMKMSENRCHEDKDEENQRKTSKLIAYLSTNSENCKSETCNVLSNNQISVLSNPTVYSLKLVKTVSNLISIFPRIL